MTPYTTAELAAIVDGDGPFPEAEVPRLAAEVIALRKALEPFAALADLVPNFWRKEDYFHPLIGVSLDARLYVSELRAARALLPPEPTP